MPKTKRLYPERIPSAFKQGTRAFIDTHLSTENAENRSEWVRKVVERNIKELQDKEG